MFLPLSFDLAILALQKLCQQFWCQQGIFRQKRSELSLARVKELPGSF